MKHRSIPTGQLPLCLFCCVAAGSSFVWMSRYTSTRSVVFPEGNPCMETPAFTRLGNVLLVRSLLLAKVSECHLCQWLLEQPGSSLVPQTKRVLDHAAATPVTWLRSFRKGTHVTHIPLACTEPLGRILLALHVPRSGSSSFSRARMVPTLRSSPWF